MGFLRNFFLAILTTVSVSPLLYSGHVYIRSDAPSDGNGKCWKTAFNSIDAALANLEENPEDNVFWVAAGIYSPITLYSPSGVPGGAVGDENPNGLLTYNLPDGVKIYGGFKGNEKCLDDRCTVPNPLFGLVDCDVPEKVVNYALTILDGIPSESWHVVTVGNDIDQTGAHVGLFDLTIKGGFADGPDSGTLDSLSTLTSLDYAHDAGGGLYIRFGSEVDLFNVQFIANTSSGENGTILVRGNPVISGGGAIAAFDEDTVTNVKNCYFKNNASRIFGGGGGAISSNSEANLNVINSLFTKNDSNRSGGAIRARGGENTFIKGSYFAKNIASDLIIIQDEAGGAIDIFQGNLQVESSIFVKNQALVGGGAIFFQTFLDDGEAYSMDINHCVFDGNTTGPFGGGAILVIGGGQHEGSHVTIRNSDFQNNRAGLGGAISNDSFEAEICHCSFKNNLADAWGGAVSVNNFALALLFPAFASDFENRTVTKIDHCCFTCNKTRGVQPPPFGFPPFFTSPGILDLFAEIVPFLQNIPTVGNVDQDIVSGGGAIAVNLAGIAKIADSTFVCNKAKSGTGGAILVGGVTGQVTDLETDITYNTFDAAAAFIKCSKFKHNRPNNVKVVDLDDIGSGPDGVWLKRKPCPDS